MWNYRESYIVMSAPPCPCSVWIVTPQALRVLLCAVSASRRSICDFPFSTPWVHFRLEAWPPPSAVKIMVLCNPGRRIVLTYSIGAPTCSSIFKTYSMYIPGCRPDVPTYPIHISTSCGKKGIRHRNIRTYSGESSTRHRNECDTNVYMSIWVMI